MLWVADMTYLRTWEGWLYLASVQDAYSRRIVGWSMAGHMRTELVLDALRMALGQRRPGADVALDPPLATAARKPGLNGSSQHRVSVRDGSA